MKYQSYNLTPESRDLLLNRFPPKFHNVVIHHITYKFGVPEGTLPPPEADSVKVVGYAVNDNIECLVCEIDGSSARPSGGTFHITLSHNDSASPKDSNDLLANDAFQALESISIQVVPTVNTH